MTGLYCAHELLKPNEPSTTCDKDALHINEAPGRDICADKDGLWRGFETDDGFSVDAASISHRSENLLHLFPVLTYSSLLSWTRL